MTEASIRLLSPQKYFQENTTAKTEEDLQIGSKIANFTLPGGDKLRFPLNRGNNLPLMLLADHPHFVGIAKKYLSHYTALHHLYM